MKNSALLLAFFASFALTMPPLFSQAIPGLDPAPSSTPMPPQILPEAAAVPPQNIQIELQVVTLPEKLALELIPDLLDKNKIEAANTRLQKLLREGQAKLAGWLILTTKSGQRAVAEAVEEVRFPTAFDPGQVAVTVQAPDPDAAQGDVIKIKPMIHTNALAPVPTGFDARYTGVTLEVEPVLAPDGETLDLNLVPQHMRLLGWKAVKIKYGARGEEVTVEQPIFSMNKVTTSFTLKNGQRKLLGSYPVNDPPRSIEIFIVRVEVLTLPAAKSPAAP